VTAFLPPIYGRGVGMPPIASEEELVPRGGQEPPSTYAVAAVVDGDVAAIPRLLGLTALRATFIAPGLWVAAWATGVKVTPLQLVGFALGGSFTISCGMVLWYALRRAGVVR